jgi:hypothetical protein
MYELVGGHTPHTNTRMNYGGTDAPGGFTPPYERTHELVLGDLRPLGIYSWISIGGPTPHRNTTETYMSMYNIVFISVMFLYYE